MIPTIDFYCIFSLEVEMAHIDPFIKIDQDFQIPIIIDKIDPIINQFYL